MSRGVQMPPHLVGEESMQVTAAFLLLLVDLKKGYLAVPHVAGLLKQ